MALLPSPARLRRALSGAAVAVVRRVLGIRQEPPGALRKVPDDLPRDGLFTQPLVTSVKATADTDGDGAPRAVFRVLVRDAAGKRCPDLFVEVRIAGPGRTATGDATTDLLGTAVFRMADGPGDYALTVTDVAAGALDWDSDASVTEASVTLD